MSGMSRATGRPWRRFAALLAAALAAAVLLAPADASPSEAPHATVARSAPSPEFFGVVAAGGVAGEDFARMSATGIRTLRVMLFWPVVQPDGPLTFNWGAYDYFVKNAALSGVRIFPTLYGTPGWVHSLGFGDADCGSSCPPSTDGSRDAFESFARAAAQRYGPGGSFWAQCGCPELPVRSWQIWNEQNSPKYFQPTPSPQSYVRLVASGAAGIRSVDGGAEIVLGGMWGPPHTDAVVPTATYLRQLYAVPGAAATFDSIAVHPYAASLDGVMDQMARVRKVVTKAGDRRVGAWITELGWASSGPRNVGLVKSPRGQARLLEESFRALIAKRRAWRIRGITWYSWRDIAAAQSDCVWCPHSGLRTRGGAQKPAARAYKRVAAGKR
jgi:hypothetical protein